MLQKYSSNGLIKRIIVPATSANIGAGFDSMGLALNLWNEIYYGSNCDSPLIIETDEGIATDQTNLVYVAISHVFRLFGKRTNVWLKQVNNIPMASGLGSSAACIVAGCMIANDLLGNPYSEQEIVDICCELDGHPDNVVPAIKGGVAAGVMVGTHVEYIKCDAPLSLHLAVATPNYSLHTSYSRSVLPLSYSREDVVFSLSRAIVTFAALVNGDLVKLKIVDDRIHTPYRIPLISGYNEVVEAMNSHGAIATYISGAGPTIIGMYDKSVADMQLPTEFNLRKLSITNHGATISSVSVTKR